MPIQMALNNSAPGFLIAPHLKRTFPAVLSLKSDSPTPVRVQLEVSSSGAGVVLSTAELEVGPNGAEVSVHSASVSNSRDDTTINALVDGTLEGSVALTSIKKPQLWFDGRFEVRFATGAGYYNDPRGNPDGTGLGWMWALEGEPDFVPADSVPDRIEKPVGRALRFHNPISLRSHVPAIGVFVRSVKGQTATCEEIFDAGDPAIGLPVNLGPDTYFASNQPVNPADRTAGRLPEEQHGDGFQPLALFQLNIGTWFSGGSKTGPFVPGTVESSNPRNPDSRPRGQGLESLTQGEKQAYPFPTIQEFSEFRVGELLPDFETLKESGQTNTTAFRNLRARIGHLLSDVNVVLRAQILSDHSDVGLVVLPANASFAWGQFREVYRGLIDDSTVSNGNSSPFLTYVSSFSAIHFLSVFFNFHTDEACAHVYGAIDPLQEPDTL